MQEYDELVNFKTVTTREEELIFKRRKELKIEDSNETIGLALSGGGIRSATFNLGLLQAFNANSLLKRADYISSVSGGGYVNSFIQKRLQEGIDYSELFNKSEIKRLKEYRKYLTPYSGFRKTIETITFYLTFIILAILHFIWYFLFFTLSALAILTIFHNLPPVSVDFFVSLITIFLSLLLWYYFMHPLRHYSKYLWNDRVLFYLLSFFAISIIISFLIIKNVTLLPFEYWNYANGSFIFSYTILIIIMGYFANPNILSMHRYYRLKITDAYLDKSKIKVSDLTKNNITIAPYPLICSTLNMQADEKIKGQRSCDYYLFSPLYCGSKLTGYVSTSSPLYKKLTLGTAVTVSGAALNSLMGYKSNRLISFVLTILNIRLGYWAINPMILDGKRKFDKMASFFLYNGLKALPVYWPFYNFSELFGKMNSQRWMVNLSDGGGIENLGAYELFRRKVKVIICSDAGADPKYEFEDLRNLLLRVRNELEIAVEFEKGQKVEDIIKPKPSSGYSQKHYVVGKYYLLPSKEDNKKEFLGYFVYIKTSVTAPIYKIEKDIRKSDYYGYKNHHPLFPHEPTTDQFFDPQQWEAYHVLGEEVGNSLLKEFSNSQNIEQIKKDLERVITTGMVCEID